MKRTDPDRVDIILEEPLKGKTVMEKSVPQTFSSAANTGEKRKREGLVRREGESRNSSDHEDVIIVGDTTAIKDLGFGGGEQSQRSVFSKRQAFDLQSNMDGNRSLEKEEAGEEPERAKQVLSFNDFDKLREESNFTVGQIWALYDTVDGMPRLYAQIRKVSVPGFDVSVTWLEPDPYDEEPIQRYEKDLPVSVGRFKLGKYETIKDHTRFSHVVHCNEGNGAGSVQDSLQLPGHKLYAFAEIVSESTDLSEPSTGFLHKAKGFLSLFCRFTKDIVPTYICRHYEYQFSHCVPSFKTTGKEAEGVPQGAYELDPAALPANIKEIDVPLHLLPEPTDSTSENSTHSQSVHFASKGRTFQTGQIWSFCSGEDNLPRYYGKIQKITFIQAFEQDPVVKLHVGRLKAISIKGNLQWIDKSMPIGCGNFRATKSLEIFTDLDSGDIWAIYRNWSTDIEVSDLQSQTYDLVEVLDDKDEYKVLLLAPDGGFKLADRAGSSSVYLAATEHWIDGVDVRFTILKSELLRFSHQVPTLKVTKEIHGAMQEVYEPNIETLPVNLIL
ncbi:hypothetical protein CARUB_v10000613mg [Capsella rubella]|uniref:DUF3444 domain-containing protein n=1 Tax=Capsella rubella TaxID=81985 RepID=R0H674_9BRAS|nr:hypothetical protein CARUB_v10000613mg [Capsella rubella]